MELFRALGSLVETPTPETASVAALLDLGPVPDTAAYSDLFLFQLYPFASVYLGLEGHLGGEARDRVAGFWRALDETPPTEPDHLATLLGLYARLTELERTAAGSGARSVWRRTRHACLWEHLASWVPTFLAKLRDIAPPFYDGWGELLEVAIEQEIADLGALDRLPLALRVAPPMPDPRASSGSGEFLAALLSPVRSGLVLTRSDLARAGRELGLGLRVGERRFILRAMLGQDPEVTLGWLAGEAAGWAQRHDRTASVAPELADFWIGRAAATASLLRELGEDARRWRREAEGADKER
jgi:TorA maturation chaperone TorD